MPNDIMTMQKSEKPLHRSSVFGNFFTVIIDNFNEKWSYINDGQIINKSRKEHNAKNNMKNNILIINAEIACESCLWYGNDCSSEIICEHFTLLQNVPEAAEWNEEIREFDSAWIDYIDEDCEIEGHYNHKAGE